MAAILEVILFVALALIPVEWPVLLMRMDPDALCIRNAVATRMDCKIWDAQGVKTDLPNQSAGEVVALLNVP